MGSPGLFKFLFCIMFIISDLNESYSLVSKVSWWWENLNRPNNPSECNPLSLDEFKQENCEPKRYEKSDVVACFDKLASKLSISSDPTMTYRKRYKIALLGDSRMRMQFYSFMEVIFFSRPSK